MAIAKCLCCTGHPIQQVTERFPFPGAFLPLFVFVALTSNALPLIKPKTAITSKCPTLPTEILESGANFKAPTPPPHHGSGFSVSAEGRMRRAIARLSVSAKDWKDVHRQVGLGAGV